MKPVPFGRMGRRTVRLAAAVSLAYGAGMLAGASAFAAAPPAGTSISNQATASYKDSSGAQQLATSNTVVTTVTQVGAFSLTPASNTKSAAAGATVYMAYVLTNTGNGSDSFTIDGSEAVGGADFSKIEIYLDNGAGLPASTTPLCTQSTAGSTCTTSKTLANGESFKFVVAYTVPSTATPSTWPGPTGKNTSSVSVKPTSNQTSWFSTYAQYNASTNATASETRTDTVNLTTGAAFSVGNAIIAPAVSPVGGGNWPVATSGPRSTTTTTITISYSNTGATSGNLYIKDVLPAGFNYVSGKSVISCAAATALTEASGGDNTLCSSQGIEFEQSGQTIQAMIPNVPPVSNGTLSFEVTVANTASIGTASTSNVAQYTANGCSSGSTIAACSAETLTSTNASEFTVTASRSVTVNTVDSTAGTPASSSDGKTSTNIVPGSYVKQTHTITNTGNAEDNFNLTVVSTGLQAGKSAFPSGTTFSWFASDGKTPLLDTNSDGTIDTGVMSAGSSKDVVLQIFVPLSTTVASPANLEAVALATSVNDATVKDATYADVTNVIGGYVDLTNSASGSATAGDIGPGPGQSVVYTSTTVQAGTTLSQIPLYIKNYDSVDNSYTFQASSSTTFPGSLPAGWSVSYSSSACSSITPISSISVTSGAQQPVYACVTSPVTAVTTNQPLYIKVTSVSPTSVGATASDTIYDEVSVVAANAYSMSVVANGSGTVAKGNNVDYSHTVTNTGSNTCGAGTNYLKVTADLTAAQKTAGWTTAIYKDVDNNSTISAADTLITDGKLQTGGLAAGASVKLLVRVYAPGGANAGDVSNVTVVVSDVASDGTTVQSSPSGCGTQTVFDNSTVVSGTLTVVKKQATSTSTCGAAFPGAMVTTPLTAAPGDCVYYEVVATNNGASPVDNVSINDSAPTYTALSNTPTPVCTASGLTGTTVAASVSGSTISCGSAANQLAPGGSLTLRFATQIQN